MLPRSVCLRGTYFLGVMLLFGGSLRADERRGPVAPPVARQSTDWPQWLGAARDGRWAETGLVDSFRPEGPKVLWKKPILAGYSGPAVSGGKVYVCDRQ